MGRGVQSWLRLGDSEYPDEVEVRPTLDRARARSATICRGAGGRWVNAVQFSHAMVGALGPLDKTRGEVLAFCDQQSRLCCFTHDGGSGVAASSGRTTGIYAPRQATP